VLILLHVQLLIGLVLLALVGTRAEACLDSQSQQSTSLRIAITVGASVTLSGLVVSFTSLMLYISTNDEKLLYRPIFGAMPIVVALAVCAHQHSSPVPLLPNNIPADVVLSPLAVVLLSATSTFLFESSKDFWGTIICMCLAACPRIDCLRVGRSYEP
jgi:hypothetical protein